MYFHLQNLVNPIEQDEPDPAAANALQEGLGGQFGEMRTMMQHSFQSINSRGADAKPYKDLIQGIGTEEISHVELIGTTIARLLDGAPEYHGRKTNPGGQAGPGRRHSPEHRPGPEGQHPPLPRGRSIAVSRRREPLAAVVSAGATVVPSASHTHNEGES